MLSKDCKTDGKGIGNIPKRETFYKILTNSLKVKFNKFDLVHEDAVSFKKTIGEKLLKLVKQGAAGAVSSGVSLVPFGGLFAGFAKETSVIGASFLTKFIVKKSFKALFSMKCLPTREDCDYVCFEKALKETETEYLIKYTARWVSVLYESNIEKLTNKGIQQLADICAERMLFHLRVVAKKKQKGDVFSFKNLIEGILIGHSGGSILKGSKVKNTSLDVNKDEKKKYWNAKSWKAEGLLQRGLILSSEGDCYIQYKGKKRQRTVKHKTNFISPRSSYMKYYPRLCSTENLQDTKMFKKVELGKKDQNRLLKNLPKTLFFSQDDFIKYADKNSKIDHKEISFKTFCVVVVAVERRIGKNKSRKKAIEEVFCMKVKAINDEYSKVNGDSFNVFLLGDSESKPLKDKGIQNLSSFKLNSIIIENIDFSELKMDNVDFTSSQIVFCSLNKSDCTKGKFNKCKLLWIDFRSANLTESNFTQSEAYSVNFSKSNLTQCVWISKKWDIVTVNLDEVIVNDDVIIKSLQEGMKEMCQRINRHSTRIKSIELWQEKMLSGDFKLEDAIETIKVEQNEKLSDAVVIALNNYIKVKMNDIPFQGDSVAKELPFIEEKVDQFIKNKRVQSLIVYGDAGSGKTTSLHFLKGYLWEQYKKNESEYIPLYVSLTNNKEISDDVKDKKDNITLQIKGLIESEKYELFYKTFKGSQKKFVFLLDCYDEIGPDPVDIYRDCKLNDWYKSKIIVTCRSQYSNSSEEIKEKFVDFDQNGTPATVTAAETYIVSFDDNQIKNFLNKYKNTVLNDEDSDPIELQYYKEKTVDDIYVDIQKIGLQELIKNPFLLSLMVENLYLWKKEFEGGRESKVTKADVYQQFVWKFFKREIIKNDMREIIGEEELEKIRKKAKKKSRKFENDVIRKFFTFGSTIAYHMFIKDLTSIHVDPYNNDKGDNNALESDSDDDSDDEEEKNYGYDELWEGLFGKRRNKSPLVKKKGENSFTFLHKSIQDYFVAFKLFKELNKMYTRVRKKLGGLFDSYEKALTDYYQKGTIELFKDFESKREKLQVEVLSLLEKGKKVKESSELNQKLLVNDEDIVGFLMDMIKKEWLYYSEIMFAVCKSCNDKNLGIIGANMITLLNAIGYSFSKKEVKNVDLSGCILTNAIMDSLNFKESTLNGADLSNSWCKNTDFSGCEMRNTSFGRVSKLIGHEDSISQVEFHKNGKVVYATGENCIRFWDCISGKEIKQVKVSATKALINPANENIVVYLDAQNNLKLFNCETSSEIKSLNDIGNSQQKFSYTKDGKLLVAKQGDVTMLLDESLVVIKEFKGCSLFEMSHNGKLLATTCKDERDKIHIYEVSAGKEVRTLDLKNHFSKYTKVLKILFQNDDENLIIVTDDNVVLVFDQVKGELDKKICGKKKKIKSRLNVSVSDNGILATICIGNFLTLYNLNTGEVIKEVKDYQDGINGIMLNQNSQILVTYSNKSGSPILLNKTYDDFKDYVKRFSYGIVKSVKFCGKYLVGAFVDGKLIFWNLITNQKVKKFDCQDGNRMFPLCCNDMGEKIAFAGRNNDIVIMDTTKMQVIKSLSDGHKDDITSLNFKDNILASGDCENNILLWNIDDGKVIHKLSHTAGISSLNFSSQDTLVSVGIDGSIATWNISKGENILKHDPIDEDSMKSVSVCSKYGEHLAIAQSDSILLLDVSSNKVTKKLEGNPTRVENLLFCDSGKILASTGYDKAVRLWDIDAGKEIGVIEDHSHSVSSFDFNKDGKLMVTGSFHSILLWNIEDSSNPCLMYNFGITLIDEIALDNSNIEGVKGLTESKKEFLMKKGSKGTPC